MAPGLRETGTGKWDREGSNNDDGKREPACCMSASPFPLFLLLCSRFPFPSSRFPPFVQ